MPPNHEGAYIFNSNQSAMLDDHTIHIDKDSRKEHHFTHLMRVVEQSSILLLSNKGNNVALKKKTKQKSCKIQAGCQLSRVDQVEAMQNNNIALNKSRGQGTAALKGHHMLETTKEDPKELYKDFQQAV